MQGNVIFLCRVKREEKDLHSLTKPEEWKILKDTFLGIAKNISLLRVQSLLINCNLCSSTVEVKELIFMSACVSLIYHPCTIFSPWNLALFTVRLHFNYGVHTNKVFNVTVCLYQ